MSELIMYVQSKTDFVPRVSGILAKFFDNILIDEFQDFRKFDFDLIIEISKNMPNMLLVVTCPRFMYHGEL